MLTPTRGHHGRFPPALADASRSLRRRWGCRCADPAARSCKTRSARSRRELLAKPLTVDDAVQVALLNNRGCRRFSGARHHRGRSGAGRPPAEPGLQLRAQLRRGDEVEIERGLHFNLARLLACR
jgi:hypothetical protein